MQRILKMNLFYKTKIVQIGALFAITCCVAQANSITNVTVANVTPTMFTVIWRAPQSVPSISVYADSGGTTNLQGQVGIELFPLHTGSPNAQNEYFKRASKTLIRQKMEEFGYYSIRVSNCRPDTTYYFKISARFTNGETAVYPQSGLIEVKTAKTNSFLLDARQLIVNVPGASLGRVLVLSNNGAAHPLAAIVGDGCPSNNAVFNLGELFSLTGGNFSPSGDQEFIITLLTADGDISQQFTLDFTNAFSVARASGLTLAGGYEQVIIDTGSAITRSGQSGSIGISIDTTAALTNLEFTIQFPSGFLTNPSLASVSPVVNNSLATVNQIENGLWVVKLPANIGTNIYGLITNIATISFSTPPGLASAIIEPVVSAIQPAKTNGQFVPNTFARVGKIIIVGTQPVLEAQLNPDGSRRLVIYGVPGITYQIQSTTVLGNPLRWDPVADVNLTNGSAILPLQSGNERAIFYRALEISGSKMGSSISESVNTTYKTKAESKPVKILPKVQYEIH